MTVRFANFVLGRCSRDVAGIAARFGAALGIGLVATTGCVTPVELLDASSPVSPGNYTELGPAEGGSGGFSLLNMQFGASDSVAAARDAALEGSGGDALVKVSVDSRDFVFFGLFGFHRTTVRGTAIQRSQ